MAAVTLLVGHYDEPILRRAHEYDICLRMNLVNPDINRVIVFNESDPLFVCAGARVVEHKRRLTYDFLFNYANTFLRGDIVVIANADIYFDDSIRKVHDIRFTDDRLLCLSRWNLKPDSTLEQTAGPLSHDAWIFQAPLREFPCPWALGTWGGDGRLATAAVWEGLKPVNPCRDLRAIHLHQSGVRNYEKVFPVEIPGTPVPHCSVADL